MNVKTTSWLLALAAGLFAFIYFYERHLPEAGQRAAHGAGLLPGIRPGSFTSIELARSNRTVVRVERANDVWVLTAPIRYKAQQASIENLLATMGLLERQTVLSAHELLSRPKAPAEFGISPPRATLMLQNPHEQRELLLGNKTPLGDQFYFQVVGTPGVFLADAALLDRLPASADDWRDTTFLSFKGILFNRIKVRSGPQTFELERDPTNQVWMMTNPVEARADNARIDHLLHQLQSAQIRKFVTDSPTVDLEPYGLQSPDATLSFGMGQTILLVVDFGKSPTNDASLVYARRSNQTNLVLVPREFVEPLRFSYQEFRDRQLIPVSPGAIDLIEISAMEKFAVERQTNNSWRVIAPINFPADPALMEDFLANLSDLKIADFVKAVVTDFSGYGLAPPMRQYALKARHSNAAGVTNRTLAQIDFGTNQVDRIFARRGEENAVYSVSYGDADRLPVAAYQVRDRRIWDFAASNVTSVTVVQRGQTRKLVRNPSGEWALPPPFRGSVNSFAIEDTIDGFARLRAQAWVGNNAEKFDQLGFKENALQISFELKSGDKTETRSIDFGRLAPTRRPYASVTLDGQRLIFEAPAAVYEKALLYLAAASLNASIRRDGKASATAAALSLRRFNRGFSSAAL